MAIMEITIIPVGTGKPSVSEFVAKAVKIIQESGLKYELTGMGTIVEGDVEELLALAGKVHQSAFDSGAPRVVTFIKLDDRRDKSLSAEGKVKSVKEKLEEK